MDNIHIARVSEVGEREPDSLHSVPTQLRRMRQFSTERGDGILHEWTELDVSAKLPLDRRPKLRAAVELIESQDAQNLVFAFFDRSVRNMRVQLEVIDRIEKAGGNLYVLDHGSLTNQNATGKFSTNVLGSASQWYADVTSEKVIEAQEEAVMLGRYPLAKVPPGLRREGKCLAHVPSEVPIVQEAFAMRDSVPPATYAHIRDFLAENGIYRSINGVVAMLGNRIYLGHLRFGKFTNDHAVTPIIDPDVFERVGRTKSTGGRKSKSPRLLARLGVLKCGSCHGSLIMNGAAGHYACEDNKNRKCPKRVAVSAARIEPMVCDAVRLYVADARGRASAEEQIRAADDKVTAAEADLQSALRVFAGYENESAARAAIDKAQAALDTAKRDRAKLGTGKVRKLVSPKDIERHPSAARRHELWRELITDTGCEVIVSPARSRQWDADRIVIQFDVK